MSSRSAAWQEGCWSHCFQHCLRSKCSFLVNFGVVDVENPAGGVFWGGR